MQTASILANITAAGVARHIAALEGVRHPVAAPEALERAAQYLATNLAGTGYQVSDHFFQDAGSAFRNIIATREGTHKLSERIAVLAHYDTVATSPGADDNASGVAALLEIARHLAHCHFARSVHFIGVNLEENRSDHEPGSGLRGSRALAAFAREQGWEFAAVIVLESIAYAGAEVRQAAPAGVPIAVPEVGDFIAVVANQASRHLTDAFTGSLNRHRISLSHLVLEVPGNGELLPDSRRSDHAPFWDQGYPAIMLTDTTNFRNPHYHGPTDTLATLNLDFAAKVARGVAGAVLALAEATEVLP